jgi:hypothetical protein
MTFISQLPLTGLADIGGTARDLLNEAAAAVQTYEALWDDADWSRLSAHTSHLRGIGAHIDADLVQRGRIAASAQQQLRAADAAARAAFKAIGQSDGEVGEAMRETLLELFENDGSVDPQRDANRLFAGEDALFDRAKRFSSLHNDLEEALTAATVRMHALAMSGDFVALSQLTATAVVQNIAQRRNAAGVADDHPLTPDDGDRDLIVLLSAEVKKFVTEGQESLFKVLENDLGPEAFLDRANSISQQGMALPGYAARLLSGYLILARQNKDASQSVLDHQIALDLSEAIQRLMLLVVYARFAIANLAGRDANLWYGHEKRRLETRAFESKVPVGQDTPLETISGVDGGQLVQLQGFVEDLRIEDDPAPPKFSTFFMLRDAVAGTTLKIRAHQFSLAANGLAIGNYIRLNGFVRRDEPWLGSGETGIDIDRLALSELRRSSWLDDVTFRMRMFFSLYLDSMSLFHTPTLLSEEV